MTCEEIVVQHQLYSTISIFDILHDNLQLRHVCTKWNMEVSSPNTNKNSPLLSEETNASKWHEFHKICNSRWWPGLIILIPLPILQQVHKSTLIFSLRKKSDEPSLLVRSWFFVHKCFIRIIYQHTVPPKTTVDGEYYVCFQNFVTTHIERAS